MKNKEYLYCIDFSVLDSKRENEISIMITHYNNKYYVHHNGHILAIYNKLGYASRYLLSLVHDKHIPHYRYTDLKLICGYSATKNYIDKNFENWIF